MFNPKMIDRTHLTGGNIRGIAKNVNYMCLARDGKTAQGLSPNIAVLDETGQIVGPVDKFVEAIVTAQGAHTDPLLFVISTQAAADSDLLSVWIDDAQRSDDPTTICHVYEADKDCELLDETQWLKANPAMGVFRNYDDLRINLERAARVPSAEAGARNLLLNQRVSLQTLAVSPSVWKKNGRKIVEDLFLQYPVHAGLDLSARNDLTACVLAVRDPDTGLVHTKPIVFTPLDSLTERSQRDRAPYEQWVKDGFMFGLPGTHMDYDMISEHLALMTHGMEIASVQYDRWRINDFKPRAVEHGFATDSEWIACGQGFRDFSLRVEGLESLLLQEKLAHGFHPLLNLGASNAIVVTDPSGNKKYDKSKSSQRIDTLVALAMAVYPLSDATLTAPVDIDTMIV
jgi:phage terminase large subunit-like protein